MATAPSVADLMDFSSADEDEQEEPEAQPVPSFNIVMKSLQIVKAYFLSYEDQEKNLQSISILEDAAFTLNSMTKKQSTITDCFQPELQDSQLNVLKWSLNGMYNNVLFETINTSITIPFEM